MAKHRDYKISIGTSDQYEDYIAEVHFPGKAGLIISQEKSPGEFEVSIHSFAESAGDDFDYCRNVEGAKIPLAKLQRAIENAISELTRLKKK